MYTKITIFKEGGQRKMLLISSNAYKDREDEIVRYKALKQYADNYTGDNPVLFWHGGDAIGRITEAKMIGPFLIELAEELPDTRINLARGKERPIITTVKQIWDAIASSPGIQWGASIGFGYIKEDRDDGIYEVIKKVETSVLPIEDAANAYTLSHIIGGTTDG